MSRSKIYNFLSAIIILLIVFFTGCDRLSVKKSLAEDNYNLYDQSGDEINFPSSYNGKVMLVGYVYTHCPDICPLITFNMRDIQLELPGEEDFLLVSISFDPTRDTPAILYDYANNYKLDQSNWRLLTGNRNEIERALETLEIRTLKTPTRFTETGTPLYFIDHTDKVTLIDKNGYIRNTYSGSKMNSERIIEDIHILLTENG